MQFNKYIHTHTFRTRHHNICRQGVALARTRKLRSQGPVSLQTYCTKEVTGSKGREGANGVGGGIEVGGGNGDGNGVGGENGNGDGDGDGAGTGTGVEVSERTQDGGGDGAGTQTGQGREWERGLRPEGEHKMGTETEAWTEMRTVSKMGTKTGTGTETVPRTGPETGKGARMEREGRKEESSLVSGTSGKKQSRRPGVAIPNAALSL